MGTEHETHEFDTTEAHKIRSDQIVEPAGSIVDESDLHTTEAEKIQSDGLNETTTHGDHSHTTEAVRVRSDQIHEPYEASGADVDVTTDAEKIQADDPH